MLLRHGTVCSAIGISEAAHLDGWSASFSDGGALSDDPLDIYQWTRDRADEFMKQAETKARLLPTLPPKVVGAFVRYWESRMVGKVKHYTLNDLVEYVFGEDEDDVEALRYTCGRLLEKMQVKAMSDLYEAELVKTATQRKSLFAAMSDKAAFAKLNTKKKWLSEKELKVLEDDMQYVATGWRGVVDAMLATEDTLQRLRAAAVARSAEYAPELAEEQDETSSGHGQEDGRAELTARQVALADAFSAEYLPIRYAPTGLPVARGDGAYAGLQAPAVEVSRAAPQVGNPVAHGVRILQPSFKNPRAAVRRGPIVEALVEELPVGQHYEGGGLRWANGSSDGSAAHGHPLRNSAWCSLLRSGIVHPTTGLPISATAGDDMLVPKSAMRAADMAACVGTMFALGWFPTYLELDTDDPFMRGELRCVEGLYGELWPGSRPLERGSVSVFPEGCVAVIFREVGPDGGTLDGYAPAVVVEDRFRREWEAERQLQIQHPAEQCRCVGPCVSSCPALRPSAAAATPAASPSAKSSASTLIPVSSKKITSVFNILKEDHDAYDGHWLGDEAITDALNQFSNVLSAASYLSGLIQQELDRERVDEQKRKAAEAPPVMDERQNKRPKGAPAPDPFLNSYAKQRSVLLTMVKTQVHSMVLAVMTGDHEAWGKSPANMMYHPTARAGGVNGARELSEVLALATIGLTIGRIVGDITLDPALASPQAGASKGGGGKSAPLAPLTPPGSRAALQSVIDSITSTGNLTLSNGAFVSAVPVSNKGWASLMLGAIPASKDAHGEVGGAVAELRAKLGSAEAGSAKRTVAQHAFEVEYIASVEKEAKPLAILVGLFSTLYCRDEVYIGGQNIGDAAHLVSKTRNLAIAGSNGSLGPPPVLVFIKRVIAKLSEYKKFASKRFWDWVKENMMAVFDYICLPHDAGASPRRLDLPPMYTSPHVPLYVGPPNPVFRPPPAPVIWRVTPNPDHGMIYGIGLQLG